jgi:hypothetical protein
MRHIFSLVAWAITGAILVSLVVFAEKAWALHSSGIALTSLPLTSLLTDVMDLPKYATYGAACGASLVLVLKLRLLIRYLSGRNKRVDVNDTPFLDVDDQIKAMRKERAEQYLAGRKKSAGND